MLNCSAIIIDESNTDSVIKPALEKVCLEVRQFSATVLLDSTSDRIPRNAIICFETGGDFFKVSDFLHRLKETGINNPVVLFDSSSKSSASLLNEKFIGRINDLIRPPYHYHILHSRLKQVVNEVSMINNNRILVVDDDPMVLKSLKRSLLEAPFSIEYEDTAEKALEHIRQEEFAVILSDIQMPGIDGVEFLGRSKEFSSDSVRMVLSGTGNMDVVVSLINHGDVWRYIEKPWDVNDLIITLKNGVELFAMRKEKQHLRSENITLKNVLHRNTELQGFSSNAPAMQKVIRTIDKVANLDSLVLIQGESGTGKELAAQMVHAKSNRALEPFVVVDCGAQSATLFESELFGHVKGAFTGAQADRKGLLEQAGNGTLFFDEIGELPLEMQTRLLRAIQEKQIRPVGETAYRPFKSRIVAATNRNLKEMVVEGSFREDLYYRLNVITLGLPPLRKRNEDISELVHFFISRHSSANSEQYVDETTLNALKNYSWPGNIRELENGVIRALALGEDDSLLYEDIVAQDDGKIAEVTVSEIKENGESTLLTIEEYEKKAISRALDIAQGNRKKAAEIVGIGEATLYRKLKEYNI